MSDLTAVKDLTDNTCGTTGCVAGWTCAIFKEEINFLTKDTIAETAQRLLDLTSCQKHFLFFAGELLDGDITVYPHWSEKYSEEEDMDLEDLPIQEAIDRLEFAIQNF